MAKKVKKKKIKIIPCLIFIVILLILYFAIKYYLNIPVKNIFIYNNYLLTDQEIIDLVELDDYPKYYSFSKKELEERLIQNSYVESVKIKRTFFHKIEIEVKEYEILLYDFPSNQYILSNGEKVSAEKYDNRGYPTLLNYVSDEVYEKFISHLNKLNDNIINQISEIKYDPSKYDNGRFFLTMNDGNYIYVNLSKSKESDIYNFELLNLYNEIYPSFEGHIGILYLDSGYGEASEYKILK